jgi:hypothetical protein
MKKWLLPFLLPTLGIAIFAIGFIYDVEFAGIPYQDPTPEMQEHYNHEAHIASVIRFIGSFIFVFGLLYLLGRLILQRTIWKKN